jgi:hypothetical protein
VIDSNGAPTLAPRAEALADRTVRPGESYGIPPRIAVGLHYPS